MKDGADSNDLISLPVAKWSLTFSIGTAVITELMSIDAMLRRRLSSFSRMSFLAASRCIGGKRGPVQTIFASRHGEIVNTMRMLHGLSHNTQLSPAAFSLSIHSTAVSLFTVLRSDHASFTAVSAGPDTFFIALQEAAGQMARKPDQSLLLIYADELLPGELGMFGEPTDREHALALYFDSLTSRKDLKVRQDILTGERNRSQPAIAFFDFLETGASAFQWNGARHAWKITLHENTR